MMLISVKFIKAPGLEKNNLEAGLQQLGLGQIPDWSAIYERQQELWP
jgi:hypothetical protein